MKLSLPVKLHFSKKQLTYLALSILLMVSSFEPFIHQANAAVTGYVRTDRMAALASTGQATAGTVCFNPATVATEAHVVVTFPATSATPDATHFGVNQTAANWTVTTTNLPSGTTAWPGIGTATAVSGGAVTFPSTDLTVGTTYCFNFSGTNTLATPTAAASSLTGTIVTQTSAPATIDTVNFALVAVAASSDTISVTASVPSTFTFVLAGQTAPSLALTTASVTSGTGATVTINTNAQNGWQTWVKSLNGALNSSTTSDTITSPGTSNATPESLAAQAGYVLDSDLTTDAANGGTVTIDPEYNGADTSSGGHLVTTFQPVASSNGPAGGDVITLIVRAKAGALNKAATDYTDTITVTGAGQF